MCLKLDQPGPALNSGETARVDARGDAGCSYGLAAQTAVG